MNAKDTICLDLKQNCTVNKEINAKDRWSSRNFTLDKIFGSATINESNSTILTLYYPMSLENYHYF